MENGNKGDNVAIGNNKELRKFKMHNNLIHTVIYQQAGSLSKAILELYMNSVDAGSTSVKFETNPEDKKAFKIIDDGKGFVDEQEIINFFETLGTPHAEGDATFGRFRIGRCQIMAFGVCIWRSGSFEMTVNIKEQNTDELGYEFKKGLPFIEGCTVTCNVYDEIIENMGYYENLRGTLSNLCDDLRYSRIPVLLDGNIYASGLDNLKWDLVTDDAYFSFDKNRGLSIYNQGAFVCNHHACDYGTGGTVVSKKPLEVNFARNEIIAYKCDVFRNIKDTIRKFVVSNKIGKGKLLDSEKQFFFGEFTQCKLDYSQFRTLKLFANIFGQEFDFIKMLSARELTWSTNDNSKLAELVHNNGNALVFNESFKLYVPDERFDVFVHTIFNALCEYEKKHSKDPKGSINKQLVHDDLTLFRSVLYDVDIRNYSNLFSDKHTILETDSLTKLEKIQLDSIRRLNALIAKEFDFIRRTVHIGDSVASEAWTDSSKYIAIERGQITKLNQGYGGFVYIASLLIHEYLHDLATLNVHHHDYDFYEGFHNALFDGYVIKGEAKKNEVKNYTNLIESSMITYMNLLIKHKLVSSALPQLQKQMKFYIDGEKERKIKSRIYKFSDRYSSSYLSSAMPINEFCEFLLSSEHNVLESIENYKLLSKKVDEAINKNLDVFIGLGLYRNFSYEQFAFYIIYKLLTSYRAGDIYYYVTYKATQIDYSLSDELTYIKDNNISFSNIVQREFLKSSMERYMYHLLFIVKKRHYRGSFYAILIEDNLYNEVKSFFEERLPEPFHKVDTVVSHLNEILKIMQDNTLEKKDRCSKAKSYYEEHDATIIVSTSFFNDTINPLREMIIGEDSCRDGFVYKIEYKFDDYINDVNSSK